MYPLGDKSAHPVQQRPDWDAALDREQQAADEGSFNDFAHLCEGRSEGGAFAEEGANRGLEFLHLHRPPPVGVGCRSGEGKPNAQVSNSVRRRDRGHCLFS